MLDSRHGDAQSAFDPEFDNLPDKGPAGDVPTNRLAVVSLIAGIVGFFVPVVGPVTAIVTGHVARGEIRRSRGRLGGEGLATAGLILGYVWIGLFLLAIGAMCSVYDARQVATPAVTIQAHGSHDHWEPIKSERLNLESELERDFVGEGLRIEEVPGPTLRLETGEGIEAPAPPQAPAPPGGF